MWLNSKPLRIVTLDVEALYSDGHHEVIPQGTGYAIRSIRTGGIVGSARYPTTAAAERALHGLQPRKA